MGSWYILYNIVRKRVYINCIEFSKQVYISTYYFYLEIVQNTFEFQRFGFSGIGEGWMILMFGLGISFGELLFYGSVVRVFVFFVMIF